VERAETLSRREDDNHFDFPADRYKRDNGHALRLTLDWRVSQALREKRNAHPFEQGSGGSDCHGIGTAGQEKQTALDFNRVE